MANQTLGPYSFVIQVFTFSAYLNLWISITFPLKTRRHYSFSKLRSERSKAKSVKSTFLGKQQHARIENPSLWCARDLGKRKYYRELCSKRLESKHNLTWVKDAINHQNLLNPKMRLYSPWGKQHDWGPPFCSISLQGWEEGAKDQAEFQRASDAIWVSTEILLVEQQQRGEWERNRET